MEGPDNVRKGSVMRLLLARVSRYACEREGGKNAQGHDMHEQQEPVRPWRLAHYWSIRALRMSLQISRVSSQPLCMIPEAPQRRNHLISRV